MNRNAVLGLLLLVLSGAGCGSKESTHASPLSIVPENPMSLLVLNDISGVVRNIDGYIEEGVPALGGNLLENIVCIELDIQTLDEMAERYGIDPSGKVVFFMESAMPQSMGIAADVPDFELFVSLLEEQGAVLREEDPSAGSRVYSFDSGSGRIYTAGSGGVAVMAMTAARLGEMLDRLSGEEMISLQHPGVTMRLNLSMVGPMTAMQMPMVRTMVLQEMSQDPEMPYFMPDLMNVYFDGIDLFLAQANMLEMTVDVGTEDFTVKNLLTFAPGSELEQMLVSVQERDMLALVPGGDVATMRFQMPEQIALAVTDAFMTVFLQNAPLDVFSFWAGIASNAAFAMWDDSPMHILVAYELSGDQSLEEIALVYSATMEAMMPLFTQNPEIMQSFTYADGGIAEHNGHRLYSVSMTINMDELQPFTFNYWMAVHDGALLLECSPEPDMLIAVLEGDYQPASVRGTGGMAGEMSLVKYFALAAAFTPEAVPMPQIGSDVTVYWDGGAENGSVRGEYSMNGADAVAAGFSLYSFFSGAF